MNGIVRGPTCLAINPLKAEEFVGLNKALITKTYCLFSVTLALGPHKYKPSSTVALLQSLAYPLNTIRDLRFFLSRPHYCLL